MIRGLGTVPGPIVFGTLIDITCMMWHNTVTDEAKLIVESIHNLEPNSNNRHPSNLIKNGSCRVYDNTTMSQNVMFVSIGWKIMATLSMAIALYFSKKSDRRKIQQENVLSITNEEGEKQRNKDAEEAV